MLVEGGRRKVPLHLLQSPTRMNPDVHVHEIGYNWITSIVYTYVSTSTLFTLAIDRSLAAIYKCI